jgi:hypothetical protein
VLSITFSPDGQSLGATSRRPIGRLFRRAEPISGDASSLQLWAEVLTGLELESDGQLRVINAKAWNERRIKLERSR